MRSALLWGPGVLMIGAFVVGAIIAVWRRVPGGDNASRSDWATLTGGGAPPDHHDGGGHGGSADSSG
jgi:hypothetical protein